MTEWDILPLRPTYNTHNTHNTYSGIVTQSFPAAPVASTPVLRKLAEFPKTIVWSGRRPVMKEAREGPHTACWQYAFAKVRPVAARWSRLGVIICVWPYLRGEEESKRAGEQEGEGASVRSSSSTRTCTCRTPHRSPHTALCTHVRREELGSKVVHDEIEHVAARWGGAPEGACREKERGGVSG